MWIFLILTTALVVGLVARKPRHDMRIMVVVTLAVVGIVAIKDRLG